MNRASRALGWVIGTWFGLGFAPKAPGAAGTLGAIPLYLAAARYGCAGVGVAAFVVTAVGIWAASVVARDLGAKDPQVVVVDEVAGFVLTMLPVREASWVSVAIGFVVFRVFDIVKPAPARALERLPGGWGIVLDDTAAGLYGAAVMAVLGAVGAVR
jgi:phosphatidylglycerophosphatase A